MLALVLASTCLAQFETASVLGTVLDAHAAAIPEARVSLQSLDTGTMQASAADASGNYQFLEVRVGRYRVVAEAAGFKKAETPAFKVDVGARQRVDVALQVGDVTETVQVEASAAVLEPDSSDRGQVVNREAVVDLPLNGRSNASLTLLSPGVRLAYGLSKRESSFNIGGLRSQFNNFILDGVDNNAYGTSNQGLSNQVIQVAPDAVAEFKVITNSYSAEYGRVGGGVINASVRSGSNQLHGTVWEFLRNTDLNATGFFKPVGGEKPVYIQNQFGAAAGGPIKKDKLFIFADYEGWRRLQKSLSFSSVPTLDQRNGIFTIPVANPYDGTIYPNNTIPASQITKFGATVFNALPAPNLPGNTSNFSALLPATDTSNKGDIRSDWYINNRITAFSRFSDSLYYQLAAPNSGIPGPSGQGAGIISRVLNWQTASGITWTINPSSIMEFRMGASKVEGMKTPATLDGGPDMLQLYGIPGLPSIKALTGGLNTQNITGYQSYGRDYTSPQWQNPLVINPKLNYSRIWGRHTLKAGYEYQAIDTLIDDFNPAYGQDLYGGQFTNPTPSKSNTIYNLADFLLGVRNQYWLVNYSIAHFRQRMHFGYLQDDFKVSQRLTLNIGLRYEFATPQYDRDNHMSNYDPATNSLVLASNGSIASRALVDPRTRNFGPRLGLAYSLNPKTVIRTGYGISYVLFERQGSDSYLAYNGPFVVNAQITQAPSQGLCPAGSQSLTCFRTTEMGYPDNLASQANFSTVNTKTVYIPKDIRMPYVQNWHFTVQRELAKDLVLDVGYAGNRSVGLWILTDLNQAAPNLTGQNLSVKARRPDAQFDFIDANFSAGFSSYNALQVKLEKRYASGLYVLNSFTWSKAIDNAAGALETSNGDGDAVDLRNFNSSKGLSGYNQPLNNTTTLVWSLPFGHARRFAPSLPLPLEALLGGWSLSGINTMTSGQPINLTYDPSAAFSITSANLVYRPNIIGDPLLPSGQRGPTQYFNKNNVLAPTNAAQPLGNAGRNIVMGFPYYNLDLGIHKQFPLWGESKKLEFRAEVFNTLNKTNFSPPAGDVSKGTFGTVTSTLPARQVQFALKLMF
jgi:hypothetical protein